MTHENLISKDHWIFGEGPSEIVEHTIQTAKKRDPDDVLRVIDEYAWKVVTVMNVGDVKGQYLDKEFKECNPTAIELGSLIGYSAVHMARLLKPGGRLYTIEISPKFAKLTRRLVDFAGVGDKVIVIEESTETAISNLKSKYGIDHIDFVFIDHWMNLYKRDLESLLKTGLFRTGTVVLADNVIFHGEASKNYLDFVRSSPRFQSELFSSLLEYRNNIEDGIEKSVFLR